jgi:hypothetical protein
MSEFGCQESQLVACRIAPRHAGFRILAKHTGTTPTRSSRCKQRLRTVPQEVCVNVFGRDAFLAAKPNGSFLIILYPLNERP